MSRSEIDPSGTDEFEVERDRRRTSRPRPSIERAFRWIIEYRSQPNFEHIPDRVTA